MTNRITLLAHTHWDREWYEPFEVFRARLVPMLDDALARLERDPRLTFTLDGQVALIDDYLELRPDAERRVRALVEERRLHIGPWYTSADTLLTDGEALIRNLAFGMRRAAALGGAMPFGYMPDQFGHAAQLPQILGLFGIARAALWRGVGPDRPPHAFRWVGPDGSAVTTLWLQDGYATGRRLPSDAAGFVAAVERSLERLGPWLAGAPLLVPVGDDHVALPGWLPDAADALRASFVARSSDVTVEIGSLAPHLQHMAEAAGGEPAHEVRGELRSPAFAPVLAGVASARVREKQASARATQLLLRTVEPLAAWAAALGARVPEAEIARAWRHLLHNQAHDSAAGCGVDEAHEDIRARYRWAEQLAGAARDQLLEALRPPGGSGHAVFHPGPDAPSLQAEVEIPRALEQPLVAVGDDGIARPVQELEAQAQAPIFEGEFAAAELGMYLGGLDPQTPLFNKYLSGITVHPDGPGRLRLDVGLGEQPASRAQLAADQARVATLLPTAERFRVVLHGSGTTRRVLVAAGPAPSAGFTRFDVRPGAALEGFAPVARRGEHALACGPLSIEALSDGSVAIRDTRVGDQPLLANLLVDEGDRGDLYHFEPVGAAVRPTAARVTVVEAGPLRGTLRIEQTIDLPVGLAADRASRASTTRPVAVTTLVTLRAGEARIDFTTELENCVVDHRLRVEAKLPFAARRLEVEHGLAVVDRPLDPSALGAGIEKPSPTGQHHGFVSVTDGERGAALYSRGLPEHELLGAAKDARLSLTLLRAVGWLARGDLACVDQAVGPMVATPAAQEQGAHRFEYALHLHTGRWSDAALAAEARRYAVPPSPLRRSSTGLATAEPPAGRALLAIDPPCCLLSAAHPADGSGVIVRVLNASSEPSSARLRPALPFHEAVPVDALERPVGEALDLDGRVELRPFQLFTLRLR